MRVLFTGRGSSGSWQCRGVQLGTNIGTVKAKATDFKDADLIVLVKRPAPGQIEAIKKSGKPWVWDVVDFYPQPQCTQWSRDKAIAWVKAQIKAFGPTRVVWANERMARDCDETGRGFVLHHHYRPSLTPRRIADTIRTVGYEGGNYLGKWEKVIRKACDERGMEFTTKGMTDSFDVCVAFRDSHVNGYVQKHWKSNVKLANAHGSGVPFIGPRECGYLETATGFEVWCDDPAGFPKALDTLQSQAVREEVSRRFRKSAYSLEQAVTDYKAFLCGV